MKKKIIFGIVAALLIFAVIIGGAKATEFKKLKVGVRSDVANFGYYDESIDTYYGIEIDLARELAQRMGYSDVEFIPVNSANREEKLDNGEIDCLIACYTDTDDRREKYNLSESYYADYIYVVAKETTLFQMINELEGCTIGTIGNTSLEESLIKTLEVNEVNNYNTQLFDNYESMMDAFECGSVDAIVIEGSMYYNYVDNEDLILGGYYYSSDFCVATLKNSSIASNVNSKVSEIVADGTMKVIIDRWIDGVLYGFSE